MTTPQPPQAQWYFQPKKPGAGKIAFVSVLSVLGIALSVALWWFFLGPGAHPTVTAGPTPTVTETLTPTAAPATPAPTETTPIVIPTPSFTTSVEDAEKMQDQPERPELGYFTEWALNIIWDAEAALDWIGDGSKGDAGATAENVTGYADQLAQIYAPEEIYVEWEQRSGAFLSTAQAIERALERGNSTTQETDAARTALALVKELLTPPTATPTPTPTPTPSATG